MDKKREAKMKWKVSFKDDESSDGVCGLRFKSSIGVPVSMRRNESDDSIASSLSDKNPKPPKPQKPKKSDLQKLGLDFMGIAGLAGIEGLPCVTEEAKSWSFEDPWLWEALFKQQSPEE